MNVSLRHSTNFKFRLLGLTDLVVQCFQLISGRLKSPVITMCEYLSPDVDLIIFRSSALFSSDPPSLLYMHPKRSLVLFLSLISINKHCLKVETRFIFSAYGEFKTYIIIPYLHYFLYSWRTMYSLLRKILVWLQCIWVFGFYLINCYYVGFQFFVQIHFACSLVSQHWYKNTECCLCH